MKEEKTLLGSSGQNETLEHGEPSSRLLGIGGTLATEHPEQCVTIPAALQCQMLLGSTLLAPALLPEAWRVIKLH